MISIVYLLLYMAAGMQMIRFLLPRKSPLVRGWLGAALGMLLEMQLPALFAWLFGLRLRRISPLSLRWRRFWRRAVICGISVRLPR